MKTLSLRARLTLWYTVALVVVLLLFGIDVLLEQQRLGIRRADRELDSVHVTLANILRAELGEQDSPALAAKEAKDEMTVFSMLSVPPALNAIPLTSPKTAPFIDSPRKVTVSVLAMATVIVRPTKAITPVGALTVIDLVIVAPP